MTNTHLQDDLAQTGIRFTVETRHGKVTGGRVANGAAAFLEIPYAQPPKRFQDPQPLPEDFCYKEDYEYIHETSYASQPSNDGQSEGKPREDVIGLGAPTEDALFLDIVCPPSFPEKRNFPVKVYIHGGFLQFGSPHGVSAKAIHVSAKRSEVWVNIGYRLSAFGFLASDEPRVDGNFGFKDQWMALEWIRDNIFAFGGDPNNVQLTGLSAGAHSVHQMLHYASHLPAGEKAPFQSAQLQSNAMLAGPKTLPELRPQFDALCKALDIDPRAPDALEKLYKVKADDMTHVIETDAVGTEYGTYRGCADGQWMQSSPDAMTWQRSGQFAAGLRSAGVRSVIVGDLTEEFYLYSIAHPIDRVQNIKPNLERYFSEEVVAALLKLYEQLPEDASQERAQSLFGYILSDAQVHLPVRILTRDLLKANFPVLRYEIRWTPEQHRVKDYVTHGTDRYLWTYQLPVLDENQALIAAEWLSMVDDVVQSLESEGESNRSLDDILTLTENRTVEWTKDKKLQHIFRLLQAFEGEE